MIGGLFSVNIVLCLSIHLSYFFLFRDPFILSVLTWLPEDSIKQNGKLVLLRAISETKNIYYLVSFMILVCYHYKVIRRQVAYSLCNVQIFILA